MSQFVLFNICEGEVEILGRHFTWERAKEFLEEWVVCLTTRCAYVEKEDWNEYTVDWSRNGEIKNPTKKNSVLRLIRFESKNQSTFYKRLR